jgi:hypothetical protein
MPAGFTQSLEDEYWGYLDRLASETRNQIENMPETTTPLQWSEEFERMGREQTCSARFFLMSWLEEHAQSAEGDYYTFSYRGKTFRFHTVTAEYALALPDEERDAYIKLLTSIAADNHEDSQRVWKPLFWRAMLRNKSVRLLNRQESFQLAHGLRFNLKQAEKFLICVLENDGFSYVRSEDLIETFCFLNPPSNNWYAAQALKERYEVLCGRIPKNQDEGRPEEYTRGISLSLPALLKQWNRTADEDTVELFLDWMKQQAPNLDVPSRTAHRLYRRLAGYAHQLTTDPESITYEDDFVYDIQDHCYNEMYDLPLDYDVFILTEDLLRTAATEFDNERKWKPELVWRYLTVEEDGKVSAQAIGSRLPQLLTGEIAVTKADLLFLLWYTCDLFWTEALDSTRLYDRLCGFWTLAEELLSEALLPRFYAPHLLERSFLNAICSQSVMKVSPFEIYEEMCELVLPEKQTRNRKKQVSEKVTKANRALMEKKTTDAYCNDQLDFEGIETALLSHLLKHARIKGQYQFSPEGISFLPNPEIVVPYRSPETGNRFDQTRADYRSAEETEHRFRFVYGLSLYLMDYAAKHGFHCSFRTNYQKNVTLTLLEWEAL